MRCWHYSTNICLEATGRVSETQTQKDWYGPCVQQIKGNTQIWSNARQSTTESERRRETKPPHSCACDTLPHLALVQFSKQEWFFKRLGHYVASLMLTLFPIGSQVDQYYKLGAGTLWNVSSPTLNDTWNKHRNAFRFRIVEASAQPNPNTKQIFLCLYVFFINKHRYPRYIQATHCTRVGQLASTSLRNPQHRASTVEHRSLVSAFWHKRTQTPNQIASLPKVGATKMRSNELKHLFVSHGHITNSSLTPSGFQTRHCCASCRELVRTYSMPDIGWHGHPICLYKSASDLLDWQKGQVMRTYLKSQNGKAKMQTISKGHGVQNSFLTQRRSRKIKSKVRSAYEEPR